MCREKKFTGQKMFPCSVLDDPDPLLDDACMYVCMYVKKFTDQKLFPCSVVDDPDPLLDDVGIYVYNMCREKKIYRSENVSLLCSG